MPTGHPRKDARLAVKEMLEIVENTTIYTEDDFLQFKTEIQDLVEKYEGYYMDMGNDDLQEFRDEIDLYLERHPDINTRLIEGSERIQSENEELDYF